MPLAVIASDVHFPYHSRRLWSGFCRWCVERQDKIEEIYFNGDMVDLDAISRYQPKASTATQAIPQIQQTVRALNALREACPGPRMVVGMGNHEARWEAALLGDKAREFEGAVGLTLKEQMRAQGLHDGVTFHEDPSHNPGRTIYGYRVAHGDKTFGRYGKLHVAHGLLGKFWSNYAVGHFHRSQLMCKTTADGEVHVGISIPTMQDRSKQEFCADPDWQMGFLVLSRSRAHRGSVVSPYMVLADNEGRFSYDGEIY